MQGQRLGNGFVHAILRAGNASSAQLNLLPRHFFIVTNWTAGEKDAEPGNLGRVIDPSQPAPDAHS